MAFGVAAANEKHAIWTESLNFCRKSDYPRHV